MLAVNKICVTCEEYLCPSCFSAGNFHVCEKCNEVNCYSDICDHASFCVCQVCGRKKCTSCIQADKEDWYSDDGWEEAIELCPDCTAEADEDYLIELDLVQGQWEDVHEDHVTSAWKLARVRSS